MAINLSASTQLIFAVFALALPSIGNAQNSAAPAGNATVALTSNATPIYDSANNANRMTSTRFTSTEDNARPGEYFFGLGANAFRHKDYPFAVRMYEVAASWAYKPAEYNLAVMYALGQGVPVDQPRAMAWMALAAERGEKSYVEGRELINAKLSKEQFLQADAIYGELYPTYGDASALHRAKERWAQVRSSMTGSRVGSVAGELKTGALPPMSAGGPRNAKHSSTTTSDLIGGEEVDGSIAYEQLLKSDNPYDPKFEWRPGSTGKVTVEPMTPVKKSDVPSAAASSSPPPTDNPNH
ncbi:MAG: sel1 repeat family protein [Rhodanobacter sp.]